jgi:hypothetical protein
MINDGERHLCEWRYGMAPRFYCAIFAAMVQATETEIDRLSQGFPSEVDAYRRHQTQADYWPRIEQEWRGMWPTLYGAKAGGPVGG